MPSRHFFHPFDPDHNGECLVCDDWADGRLHGPVRRARRVKQVTAKFIRGQRLTPRERKRLTRWINAAKRAIGEPPLRPRPDGRISLLDL